MKEAGLILKYLKKNKVVVFSSLVFGLLFVVAMVLVPLFTGKTLDEIIKALNGNISLSETMFYTYLIVIFALIMISVSFQFLFEYNVYLIVEKISKNLKDDLFKKINKVSIKYIDSHSHGDLLSRLINDNDNVNIALLSGFKQFYQGTIQITVTLIIIFIFNWILALIVVLLTPLCFLISYFVAKNTSKYFKKQAQIQGNLGSIVLEDFNNLDILKSFNYEDSELLKFSSENKKLYKEGQKAQFFSSLTNPLTRLINNSTYAIVGVTAAILCALSYKNGYMIYGASCTIGTILTFLQYSNQFAKPFNEISSCLNEIQTGFTSLKRIDVVLNEKDDIDLGKIDYLENIKEVNFNHLFFSYEPEQKLIENFNLNVKKGMKIAIVGPTGCGKTTLINLLLRFYDPNKGSIMMNEISSLNLTKKELRRHFSMVLQDSWLFKGTVKENIAYSKPDASDEEIIEASKKANAYDFIVRLNDGFNTMVNDNSGLSAGEKQLICIARVMLKHADIVILDEATSNIDTMTEMKISDAFNIIMKDKTSFVIAHRLSTIENSDLIIVMDKGHILETGKHQELLAKKGFYYKLYNSQYSV